MINIGDKFYLSYCPAIKFKLVSISKLKDKEHTFQMIGGSYDGSKFTRKPADMTEIILKDWIKFE